MARTDPCIFTVLLSVTFLSVTSTAYILCVSLKCIVVSNGALQLPQTCCDWWRWWARYRSIRVFRRFRWFTIFARPSAALYDSDNIVGRVSSHWQFTRCHSDHFRSFPMFYNVFMEFLMFACLYLTYHYINGLSMHPPYYSTPIRCVPDILRLCFDFIYLWRYWYSDVSIIYSFGWLYHYYSFRLWSLVVYNPSDAISTSPRLFLLIFTYHSHLHNNNIVLRSPDLRETSYHFDSTSTSFPFVPRPYISHIDLDMPCSTSILWLFIVLARVLSILLWSRLIFCYIHRTSYTYPYIHLHSLSDHFRIGYWPYITLYHPFWPYRNSLPELRTFRSLCFQYYSVGVVVSWPYSISGRIIFGAHREGSFPF